MNPQERAKRHPVLKFWDLKKPRGRSLMLGLTRNVEICGRVRRRKPSAYVLFYLCPCAEDSVSKIDAMQIRRSQTLYFFNIALHFFNIVFYFHCIALYFHDIELHFLRIFRHLVHGRVRFVDTLRTRV